MKAWLVTIQDWDDLEVACAGQTSGQVKSHQYMAAHEAGWDVPFVRFRATRAPEFDYLAQDQDRPTSLGWRHRGETWGCFAEMERSQ